MKLGNVKTLKLSDPYYPDVLKQIDRPPKQLYYVGSDLHKWIDRPRVAIVGSRKASSYGKAVTEELAARLARAGVVIISGLAYGIDATAQQASVAAGGITVAVLATPLGKIYPASHEQLAKRIVDNGGTLIREHDDNTETYRASFIERNRLISGLADVVIVAEAALRSGSLATARFALEQGKTVMAVPGNITSLNSVGCNNLIKSGALPVTEAEDIFFALGLSPKDQLAKASFRGSREEELIFDLIRSGIASQEELATVSRLDGPAVNNCLTMLEIAGVIRPEGGGKWSIV